ncbi:MAG: ribonuclease HI [Clostridia bacterium]|nr:ribonuclease HI [Clostridia bacterium]
MNKKFEVTIYTDGACSGNPGKGGWGAILMCNGKKREMSGHEKETTNNRMEMTAVIKALEALKEPCIVELYSDSAYVCNAWLQDWISVWKNNGWRGADKKPVKNQDLWMRMDELCNLHEVTFIKVKGHADNEFNNRCDALATSAILEIKD